MRKYQSVEKTKVLSPKDHKRIEAGLRRLGKVTMNDLTEQERWELTSLLDRK